MAHRPVFLVVDDTPLFRELETLCLSRYGQVVAASSGLEALESVRRHRPDLVLLDLVLPDLDGLAVCREIRCAPSTRATPVIAVGSGMANEHACAIEAGASDVLAKPLSREVLLGAVRRFVSRSADPVGLPRVKLDTPVRVAGAGESRLTLARNLSRGGMFIESRWSPPEGSELRLSFVLPECPEQRFEPTAKVVWHRSTAGRGLPGFGVRFHALDRDSARSLDSFVRERISPAELASTPESA